MLAIDAATWGCLTLLRARDRDDFAPGEVALVASMSGHLAEGLRRTMLRTVMSVERRDDKQDHETGPGFALLAPDNSVMLADSSGERWLAELRVGNPGRELAPVVAAVASRARSVAEGHETAATARARVRTASGRWLVVRGSGVGDDPDGPTAVIVEPARPHELAPLIADAYGLTGRECAVTQLVAQGLATSAIAARLHISTWTVQDHLKAIFGKVGVSTRGELVARVFFEHYAPRLTDRAAVGPNGWFAPGAAREPV